MLPCWAHGSLMRLYILIKPLKPLQIEQLFSPSYVCYHMTALELDARPKKIQLYSPRKKWLWFRDPAIVDVQEERVRVRKQHRAVEGSQTGPLEDGTWGILAICLSFVLSYKVRAPFIMLRQRGAWLWQRIWATGEKGGISEVSLLAAFKQGQPLHWLWHN